MEPIAANGTFLSASPSSWILSCRPGKMPSNGNVATCMAGVLRPNPLPTCVDAVSCKTTLINNHVRAPINNAKCGGRVGCEISLMENKIAAAEEVVWYIGSLI